MSNQNRFSVPWHRLYTQREHHSSKYILVGVEVGGGEHCPKSPTGIQLSLDPMTEICESDSV